MTKYTIKYESEPCSRCGGSGNYSYNQIDGTRCFKCRGCGVQYTRRGKAAQEKVQILRESKTTMLVEDVRAGMYLVIDRRTVLVQAVEENKAAYWKSKSGVEGKPGYVERTGWFFYIKTEGCTYSMGNGSTVHRAMTADEMREVAAYALTLKGVVSAEVKEV